MAVRFAAFVPRMAVVGLVWLFATGTLTFAAERKLTTPVKKPTPVVAARPTLVIPDIRGQAFVFAKGILEDGGFGWRVAGGAQGYATNVVTAQRPAPGTRVVDTGAPTLTVSLKRGTYRQDGRPENASPYAGTAIVLARSSAKPAKKAAVAKRPTAPKRATHKPTARPAPHKPAAKPAKAKHQKLAPKKHKPTAARVRPPAFVVAGAPKEPLKEIPLTVRAERLNRWLTPSRRPTAANQRYWLYQHAWIVTGAKFGWWHGAAALRVLISVDRRVESQWGIGSRSATVARAALAAVEARAK